MSFVDADASCNSCSWTLISQRLGLASVPIQTSEGKTADGFC